MVCLLGITVAIFLTAAPAAASRYKIDDAHTSVTFGVRHLFTTVQGRFSRFEGTINFDDKDPAKSQVEGSIDAASIDTNVQKRDDHLRSKDFFWAEQHPKIIFKSTKVTDVDLQRMTGKLHGDLMIRGVTKPVVLDVAFLGVGKDPWGNTRAGFRAETTINRKDFGLTWNQALETGGVLVGEEVKITIDAEAVLEK